ncbi:hypothetical protein TNCV_652161 [Trichonephila clavipes]|nr:hypothetical protein TNCV_652161 [Trichonephila clavipes]
MLSVTEMGIDDLKRRKICSSSPNNFGKGLKTATSLPKLSQRCSIGFKSGDKAGHIIHSKRRPSRYSSTITAR